MSTEILLSTGEALIVVAFFDPQQLRLVDYNAKATVHCLAASAPQMGKICFIEFLVDVQRTSNSFLLSRFIPTAIKVNFELGNTE